jgi:hypothetical protein
VHYPAAQLVHGRIGQNPAQLTPPQPAGYQPIPYKLHGNGESHRGNAPPAPKEINRMSEIMSS